jgi:hypothetical protein
VDVARPLLDGLRDEKVDEPDDRGFVDRRRVGDDFDPGVRDRPLLDREADGGVNLRIAVTAAGDGIGDLVGIRHHRLDGCAQQ